MRIREFMSSIYAQLPIWVLATITFINTSNYLERTDVSSLGMLIAFGIFSFLTGAGLVSMIYRIFERRRDRPAASGPTLTPSGPTLSR